MVRYKDNPSLRLKTVTTVKGVTEYRKNCRKIRDKYYIIGEDCFKIDGKYYAASSKLIAFDFETAKYVVISTTAMVYGIVDFKKNGEHIFGYFTANKYFNVSVDIEGYGVVLCYRPEVLEMAGYYENLSTGIWVNGRKLTSNQITALKRITSQKVFREKGYNIEDNAVEFKEKIDAFEQFPMKVSTNAVRYARLLGDVSFGAEIETALGYIPDNIQHQTGVVICRDGSIDNAEYVTVPMRGAKGLQNLKNLSEALMQRTIADIKCSLHFHIGTIPDNRLFLTALYALGFRIQNELYTMFPYFKTKWEGIKKQDYNQRLRKLGFTVLKDSTKEGFNNYVNDCYVLLFKWLNDGYDPDDRFNRNNHNHNQTAKWNRKQRYFWMNFMNMFFSSRKTIEFRLHEATLNHHKMIPWLFICNAILKYAEVNSKAILSNGDPITLNNVMDYYAKTIKTKDAIFMSNYLKAYITDRKKQFQMDREKQDYESKAYLTADNKFTFTYEGVTGLI